MGVRAKTATGVAAVVAAVALLPAFGGPLVLGPLGGSQGGGTIDVFVGSTPTPVSTPTATPTATPPAAFTTANAWVNPGGAGASPSRCSTVCAYNATNAYGTIDAAWDGATAGDRICLRTGTFGTQVVSGNKASETLITGNCGGAVTIGPGSGTTACTGISGPGADATFCPDGNNMTLADVTINTGTANDVASVSRINASNITFRNVDATGNVPNVFVTATNFLWDGGSSGAANYTCFTAGQPTQIDSGSMTIRGVTWGAKTITGGAPNTGNCGLDGNPHLEYTRIQCNCPVTLKNNIYTFGGAPGSGYIFSGISTALDNLTVVGNYFADADVTAYMQSDNLSSCTGWKWLYNTFDEGDVGGTIGWNLGPNCDGGLAVGNLGNATGSCANHIKNVMQGSGACGTDTRIGSASLGLDGNKCPATGSPALNAAEAAPATYAQGADVGGLDRRGNTRGADGTNDAGSCEG